MAKQKKYVGKSNYTSDGATVGAIDEFRVVDGLALEPRDFVQGQTNRQPGPVGPGVSPQRPGQDQWPGQHSQRPGHNQRPHMNNHWPGGHSQWPGAQPGRWNDYSRNAVAWLNFNRSVTQDDAGAGWSAYGSTALVPSQYGYGTALQLNKGYLQLTTPLILGGQDFTVDFWLNMSSESGSYARAFVLFQNENNNGQALLLYRQGSSDSFYAMWDNSTVNIPSLHLNRPAHIALVYQHNEGRLKVYVNGRKDAELARTIGRTNFPKGFFGRSNYPSDGATVGTIDDFHIVDGEAVWTTDFQPPMPQ